MSEHYEVVNNIEDVPVFKWLFKDVIYKQDQIISRFKEKYWITTHRFGIQVTKTVDEAYKIYQQTGTKFYKK